MDTSKLKFVNAKTKKWSPHWTMASFIGPKIYGTCGFQLEFREHAEQIWKQVCNNWCPKQYYRSTTTGIKQRDNCVYIPLNCFAGMGSENSNKEFSKLFSKMGYTGKIIWFIWRKISMVGLTEKFYGWFDWNILWSIYRHIFFGDFFYL